MTVFTMIIQKKFIVGYILKPLIIIITCIKNRFNQTDYQIYVLLQEILIKAFKKQDWEDDLMFLH